MTIVKLFFNGIDAKPPSRPLVAILGGTSASFVGRECRGVGSL
jgi:hypothetical protein